MADRMTSDLITHLAIAEFEFTVFQSIKKTSRQEVRWVSDVTDVTGTTRLVPAVMDNPAGGVGLQ